MKSSFVPGTFRTVAAACILAFTLGTASAARGEVEFFFNTSPADPAPWMSRIIYSFPLASVGHGTLYISSACFDAGSETNLILPCTEEDKEKGVVLSFDVDLQKETGYYFLAVTRNQFSTGMFDEENLPEKITREMIDEENEYFYKRFPFLRSEDFFRGRVGKLAKRVGADPDRLYEALVELDRRGVNDRSLAAVLKEKGADVDIGKRPVVFNEAGFMEKKGILPEGMSRRVVTWGVRFYQGVWGLVYPTTSEEELAIIEAVNAASREEANILNVNCVMPLDIIGGSLTTKGPAPEGEQKPRFAYVPFFVLERVVKGAFGTGMGDRNEYEEFIRRPGTYMNYYPVIRMDFGERVSRAPKMHFDKPGLIKHYEQYQGKYANYVDWVVDLLLAEGLKEDSDDIRTLRQLREDVFEEEKKINAMQLEYDAARTKDPALKKKIDDDRLAMLAAFQDELSSVIGVDMPELP